MSFQKGSLRQRLHEIIFEAETKKGKLFDIILMILILISVIFVMLETVETQSPWLKKFYLIAEWIFTLIFTAEYIVRIYAVNKPIHYVRSFYGIIDLISILPTYLSIMIGGAQSLMVIRALRLLRVFRIFKMVNFLRQGRIIMSALKASLEKILVFLFFVLILVVIFGSVMYLIEGQTNKEQFDSIPRSIYWAIVTITTVGYGDISPSTVAGQFLSSILMLIGYAIIAVPTGIVTGEVMKTRIKSSTVACENCSMEGHDDDAKHCKHCGDLL